MAGRAPSPRTAFLAEVRCLFTPQLTLASVLTSLSFALNRRGRDVGAQGKEIALCPELPVSE